MYLVSCLLSLISSGRLVTSRCILSLSPALSCLDVIKDYYLSLSPRLRVPVPPSCVHRDSASSLIFIKKMFCYPQIVTLHKLFPRFPALPLCSSFDNLLEEPPRWKGIISTLHYKNFGPTLHSTSLSKIKALWEEDHVTPRW